MPTQGYGGQADWYLDTDMNVWIANARKAPTDPDDTTEAATYLTDSNTTSITGSMKDTAGTDVTNATSITFTYQGTNGRWKGRIPYNAAMTIGSEYRLSIVAIATTGERMKAMLQGKAIYYGGESSED